MATFHLKVLTVDGPVFEGDVNSCIVRTIAGDVGILPRHIRYVAALGIGSLIVNQSGKKREAAIAGGFVDVSDEGTVVFARTCEWAEDIDVNRARKRVETGKEHRSAEMDDKQAKINEYKIKRALNRIRVAEK